MAESDSVRDKLDARLADWESRLDRLESDSLGRTRPEPGSLEEPDLERDRSPDAVGRHLLFVSSPGGYVLVEGMRERPRVGDVLELDGREGRFAVTRIVRSPLPGDRRPCAFLEAI